MPEVRNGYDPGIEMTVTKKRGSAASIKDADGTQQYRIHRKSATRPGHKFLFVSCGNGVGKTTVALSVALALSKKGFKIGLLDLDPFSPGIPSILGIDRPFESDSKGRFTPGIYSANLKVAAIRHLPQRTEKMKGRRKAGKIADIQRFIHNINWRKLDYLFADTAPGSGKGLRDVIRSMPDAKIIIVTAPRKISTAQAKSTIDFFRKEKIQIFGWIENMRGFLCQQCHQRQELFSTGTGKRAVFLMDVPFLGRIPIDPHLAERAHAGQPYLEKYQDAEAAIAFNQVAERISKLCKAGRTERNEDIGLWKGRQW